MGWFFRKKKAKKEDDVPSKSSGALLSEIVEQVRKAKEEEEKEKENHTEPKGPRPGNYSIFLDNINDCSKLVLTKEIKTFTLIGLKETVDLINSAPCSIIDNICQEDAEAFLKKLTELNVSAHIENSK